MAQLLLDHERVPDKRLHACEGSATGVEDGEENARRDLWEAGLDPEACASGSCVKPLACPMTAVGPRCSHSLRWRWVAAHAPQRPFPPNGKVGRTSPFIALCVSDLPVYYRR
jgi:hypothetical protein